MSKLADTFDRFLGTLASRMKRLGLTVIDAPYKERDPDEYMSMVVFGKPSHSDVQLAVDLAIGQHNSKTAVLCHLSITDEGDDNNMAEDDITFEETWAIRAATWADTDGALDMVIDEIQAAYTSLYGGSLEE
jgi:hypothetical protein